MNLFEHQFYNFNVYKHGVSSFLHQISEKNYSSKAPKTFLSVCPYNKKTEILKCVGLSESDSQDSKYIFKNSGVIMKGNRPFFSEAVMKDVSTFYAVQIDGSISFVIFRKFFRDTDVFGQAFICEQCSNDLFDFSLMNLPDVVKEILNDQNAFLIVKKTCKSMPIPANCIKYPCVVCEFDENSVDKRYLLMPCLSVAEFY